MSAVALTRPAFAGSQRSATYGPAVAVSQLPFYDLLALAGRSTFAEVWQVRDRRTGRTQALKILTDESRKNPTARQVLENEAIIGRKAASDYVVKVCDAELGAPKPYVVREWLVGQTLEQYLPRGQRLGCGEAVWIARQCVQGMHALLVAGYTHGDIQPSNIFVCHDRSVKLIGLNYASPDQLSGADLAGLDEDVLTGTSDLFAPESLAPKQLGGISRDVHSLAITLYRMLTGVLPFPADTIDQPLEQSPEFVPTRLRHLAPEVPREVAEFVHRLLARHPLRRGNGLSRLIHEMIGLELAMLPAAA